MILSFGKYRGRTLADVMAVEPEHVGWAIERGAIDASTLDADVLAEAQAAYEDERLERAAFELTHEAGGDRD